MHGNSRMANASNLHHHPANQQQQQQMNGMRSTSGDTGTVLVHHHTQGDTVSGVHHHSVVDSKSGILQHGVGNTVTDMDGNFIHDILGMNSQIEIIDEEVQQQHHGGGGMQQQQQQQQQQHQQQEVIVHQQQSDQQQSGGQQIHIQNATPEQLLELQQQGAYTQENGNRVIVVSELFKCDICNLAFIFKDHYIQHCDDHIRMVAEHINLKGIVPINNFEEANEVLDFRNEDDDQSQHQHQQQITQTIGPDGTIVNGHSMGHQEPQHQQIIVHGHQQQQQQGSHVIQQQQHHQVIQQHELLDNSSSSNGHGVVHIGGGGGVLDSSMIEDIDEGDPQLTGAVRSGGSKNSKRTSQQQLQAQLNSEWCKCLPCDFKFRTPLSLSRHLNAHMENRNRCEKCNKFFTSYVSLNTHSRQCRGDEEDAVHLNQSESSSGELGEAGERARSVSVDGPATSPGGTSHANKVYNCKKCNLQFASATQYRDHKLTHSNDVYTCNECHKAFLSIINLNRHRQNEHQQRQTYMCAICNCEFTNVEFLEEHNKTRSHLHNLSGGNGGGGGTSAGGSNATGRGRQSGGGGQRGADVVVID